MGIVLGLEYARGIILHVCSLEGKTLDARVQHLLRTYTTDAETQGMDSGLVRFWTTEVDKLHLLP